MDCLRQFQINISNNRTFSTSGTDVYTWVNGSNHNWIVNFNSAFSNFAIRGFKNIDVYGIKMIGNVQSPLGGTSHGIVKDWGFSVGVGGQNSIISGLFTTNNYNADTINSAISLTKFNNEYKLVDPLKSSQSISIGTFFASGIGFETASSIQLDITATFYFYYKYEGE